MTTALLACLLALAHAEDGASATTATIRGQVVDEDSLPIPGAVLSLESAGEASARTTTTDAHGKFTFADLPPATVALTVEAAGFRASRHDDIPTLAARTTVVPVELQMIDYDWYRELPPANPAVKPDESNRGTTVRKGSLQRLPL